jgi:hypothetical protein
MIARFLRWLLSFFEKSPSPKLDQQISDIKTEIKSIDKELEKDYTTVDESLEEFKK